MASTAADKPVEILSPVNGSVIELAEVPDPVFSKKLVGDGFGVSKPSSGKVVAPVSGKITMVADTGHAVGFKTESGVEVLVHLGIDTVELQGRPFDMRIAKGDLVEAGDTIGVMDTEAIKSAGKNTTVIVVVTNTPKVLEAISVQSGRTQAGEPAAAVTLKKKAQIGRAHV